MTLIDHVTNGSHRPSRGMQAGEWPEMKDGRPRNKSRANILAFLEREGVTLRHNDFTLRDEITRNGRTAELSDAAVIELYLKAHSLGLDPPRAFFEDVLADASRSNSHHPVREYLDSLVWDGKARMEWWLCDYAGAADTKLNRAIAAKTLLAAVRRVRQPGCKFDQCVVLEGPQGAGKSTLVRTLAGDDHFTDCVNIGAEPKVIIEQTAGAWLVEMAELSGIRKGQVEEIKAMISRQTDRARLAYGKRTVNVPRQFVLFGTVNDCAYLRDATGNRRFWPVAVGEMNIPGLREVRDQLWAEAAHREASGETLELPSELWGDASAEQSARLMTDPWAEKLEAHLEGKTGHVEVAALWGLLQIKNDRQDPNVAQRLRGIMTQLGFEKHRVRKGGTRVWTYTNDKNGDFILSLDHYGTDAPLGPPVGPG